MTRTRLIFLLLLFIILAIVALSLATQLLDAQRLAQLYIACTIFAAGTVVLDFLGIFGHDADAGDGAPLDGDSGELDSSGHDIDIDGSAPSHLPHSAAAALATLAYLRLSVYFCLGFGPTGWMALASGYTPWLSLALAVPVGLIAIGLAQALFRFQRSDTDSSLRRDDLLMQPATVTIALSHTTMGKVRIQVGMSVVEHYALAADAAAHFAKGESVRVVRVADDCVYVA